MPYDTRDKKSHSFDEHNHENKLVPQEEKKIVPNEQTTNVPQPTAPPKSNELVPYDFDFGSYEQSRYQFDDSISNIEQYKIENGYRRPMMAHTWENQLHNIFSPYADITIRNKFLKHECKKMTNGEMGADHFYYEVVDAYTSGQISQKEAKKWIEQMQQVDPNYAPSLTTIPQINVAMDLGILSKEAGFGQALDAMVGRDSGITEETASKLKEYLADSDKTLKEWNGYQFRQGSAAVLKFAGQTGKMAVKMGTSMAYHYGSQLFMKALNSQMNRPGTIIGDEAQAGAKNLAMTGARYGYSAASSALSTVSMQVKAYAGMVSSTLTEKWVKHWQDKKASRQEKLDKKKAGKSPEQQKKMQDRFDKKEKRKATAHLEKAKHAHTAHANALNAVGIGAIKQLGRNAGSGLVKGAIKSPKKMVSFSTRQLSKMATETFGQTDPYLSSIWSTTKKTLRYSKKTVKAVAKAPKRIHQIAKQVQAFVKGVYQIGRAIVQTVINMVSWLFANPIGIAIIAGALVALALGSCVGSCTFTSSELGAGILGAMFETPFNIANKMYNAYAEEEQMWYTGLGLSTHWDQDQGVAYNPDGDPSKVQSLYEKIYGEECPYDKMHLNIQNKEGEWNTCWSNPYIMMAYLTTLYGNFTNDWEEHLEEMLDYNNEDSLFYTQYQVELSFEPTESLYAIYSDGHSEELDYKKQNKNENGDKYTVEDFTSRARHVVDEEAGENYYIIDEITLVSIYREGGLDEDHRERRFAYTQYYANWISQESDNIKWEYVEDEDAYLYVYTTYKYDDDDGTKIPMTTEDGKFLDLDGNEYDNLEDIEDKENIAYEMTKYYIDEQLVQLKMDANNVRPIFSIENIGMYNACIQLLEKKDEEDAKKQYEEDPDSEIQELEEKEGYCTVARIDDEGNFIRTNDDWSEIKKINKSQLTDDDVLVINSDTTLDEVKSFFAKNSTDYPYTPFVIDYQDPYEDYPSVRQFQEICYNYGYCNYSDSGQNGGDNSVTAEVKSSSSTDDELSNDIIYVDENGETEEEKAEKEKRDVNPEDYSEPTTWSEEDDPNVYSETTTSEGSDKLMITQQDNTSYTKYIEPNGTIVMGDSMTSGTGWWWPINYPTASTNAPNPEYAIYTSSGINATAAYGDVSYYMFLSGYYGYTTERLFDPNFPLGNNKTHSTSIFEGILDGDFGWPLDGSYSVNCNYGPRSIYYGDGVNTASQYHNGIDLTASWNTPVYCIADGIVVFAQFSDYAYSGRGYTMVVYHPEYDIFSEYQHLNDRGSNGSRYLQVGDEVKKGQCICYSGQSGIGSGAHLHFEVWLNYDGAPWVDPNNVSKGITRCIYPPYAIDPLLLYDYTQIGYSRASCNTWKNSENNGYYIPYVYSEYPSGTTGFPPYADATQQVDILGFDIVNSHWVEDSTGHYFRTGNNWVNDLDSWPACQGGEVYLPGTG